MTRLYRILAFLLLSIFFFQCQKDVGFIGGPDLGSAVATLPDPIKATIQGNIVDDNDQPAAGVTITVGTETAITNANGYFRITNASLDKNTSLVTAEKAGYFKGYRVFAATSGTNQVVIKLIKRNLAGTISASSGGSAALSNGASISLPANGVVVASSGTEYAGDIKVFASYIDPSLTDIAQTVPGSFAANDINGKRVALSSFGMLAVELESSGGEKLQIKSGVVATLTSPIPSATISSAPATIALWYMDERTGVWKEEGAAIKQGNKYVGDVKHFSFWNCDFAYPAVSLSLTLINSNGSPLTHVNVKVSLVDSPAGAHGYTDSLGQVKGLVPANKNLVLRVLDPCGNSIYSQSLSPLTQNTDLGVITVTGANSSILTLRGILLDCGGLAVKNGYAIISFHNTMRYAATNATGEFTTTFTTCSGSPATIRIIGVDQASLQQAPAKDVTVTVPLTNAGNITACGASAAQFIKYTLDGTDYSITGSINDSIMAKSTTVGTTKTTHFAGYKTPDYITFAVNNVLATGTFPLQSLLVQNYRSVILQQPFNITFTNFPKAAGEFYEGTFSGKFTADSLQVVHSISSAFRVRRT